jgi:hypothetical protein
MIKAGGGKSALYGIYRKNLFNHSTIVGMVKYQYLSGSKKPSMNFAAMAFVKGAEQNNIVTAVELR